LRSREGDTMNIISRFLRWLIEVDDLRVESAIRQVERLNIQPGDMLIITTKNWLDKAAVKMLRDKLKDVIPLAMVIDDECSMKIVSVVPGGDTHIHNNFRQASPGDGA
jgi:hypothetical protein